MKNSKKSSLKNNSCSPTHFSVYLLTFFILILLAPSVSALEIVSIDDKLSLAEIQPINEKVIAEQTYIFSPDGYIKTANINNIDENNVAIGKGIIAVAGGFDKSVEVVFYTPMPNTQFSVIHYDGISNDKNLIRKEGEILINNIKSDSEGKVTYTTNSFSSQILSFPSPLEHETGTDQTNYYLNYFFTDYDRVRITSDDIGISGFLENYLKTEEPYDDDDYHTDENLTITLIHVGYTPNQNPKLDLVSYATTTGWTKEILVTAFDYTDDVTFVADSFDWVKEGSGVEPIQNLTNPFIKTQNVSFSLFMNDYFSGYTTGGFYLEDRNCNTTNNDTMVVSGDVTIDAQADICIVGIGLNSNKTLYEGGDYTNPLTYAFSTLGTGDDIVVYGNSLITINITDDIDIGLFVDSGEATNASTFADFVVNAGGGGGSSGNDLDTSWLQNYYSFDTALLTDDYGNDTLTDRNGNIIRNGTDAKIGTYSAFATGSFNGKELYHTSLENTEVLSINFWSRNTDVDSGHVITNYGGGDDRRNFAISNGNMSMMGKSAGTYHTAFTDDVINDGLWRMYSGTWDETNGYMAFWVDSVLIENLTYTHVDYTFATLSLFAYTSQADTVYQCMECNLDEVAIMYVPLTQEAVNDLYNNGSGLPLSEWGAEGENATELYALQTFNFPELIDLEYDEEVYFDFDDYFSLYDEIRITFFNASNDTQTINASINTSSSEYVDNYIDFSIDGNGATIRWFIEANETNYTTTILVEAGREGNYINDTSVLTIGDIVIEPEPPTQIIDFNSTYNMEQSSYMSLNMGGYFTNYLGVTISYQDDISNTTISNYTTISGAQKTIVTDDVTLSIRTLSSNILLEITTKTSDFSNILYVNVSNPYGEIGDGFLIRVDTPAPANETQFQTWFGGIEDIFPDEEELSLGQQLLYVIIVLFFTAIAIGAGAFSVKEELVKNLILLSGSLLVILEIFFFIAIGYIPVIVLVLLALGASLIVYAIFRKSTA